MIHPEKAVRHLQPEIWVKVNRVMIAKAISEFAHERLLEPRLLLEKQGWNFYGLGSWEFRAQILPLDHWLVDRESLVKKGGQLSMESFVLEFREALGLTPSNLPDYLSEVASTLYGSAYKEAYGQLSAADLTRAPFQLVEKAMSEGHPVFVANNARMGFDASDYPQFAPEAAEPLHLIWLAGHRSQAQFNSLPEFAENDFLRAELGVELLSLFEQRLEKLGLDPADYIPIPVHPWQWFNQLAMQFAGDIAEQRLIYLGYSADTYQPQQSIRTLFNASNPEKCYVKTSLSILNMGFTRGLSPKRMITTPAVNGWVSDLIASDAWLSGNGFSILREVATVGYRHKGFEAASDRSSDTHKEMLAALWRESPMLQIQPGQRLMTMASLLHRDRSGTAVLMELIRSSPLDTTAWLQRYLHCYLKPQLHCLYAHHLIFTPHGENVILVLEDNIPVRIIMKDIAEDIGVVNPERPLPDAVRHLGIPIPEDIMTLSVFTDVFDCFFRYLVPILLDEDYAPQDFWRQVAICIHDYQKEQTQFADKYQRYDLFAPNFPRNCLNRLQLRNNQEMIDLNSADPAECLQFAGTLDNPIAAWRRLS